LLHLINSEEILAALPLALIIIDEFGQVRDINAEGESLFNMSASAIVARPVDALFALPSGFSDANGGPFAAFDVDFDTRRGRHLRGDLHATPLVDRPGWQLLTIANARDHGLGGGLERQGSSRTAIAIAATLAHEIKNPLSGIRGAAQLLDGRVNAADAPMTRLIRTEVDRIAALIDRMEGFTDTRPIELSAQNIHAIVDHSRKVVEQGFPDSLIISDEYDPSLPPVLAHEDSLIQIVINLLKNAAETAEPGKMRRVTLATRYRHGIAVSSRDRGRRRLLPIELSVIDDGPGAPPEIAEQLFEPFVSSKRTGRGLGLALTDKLVRDMGGLIQYVREGSPPRTIFRLLLQRAEERQR
jgi:two-component system, NtrC family, nitrogen regulation sensor histidine kinase GlnL